MLLHPAGPKPEFGTGNVEPFAESLWTAATPIRFAGIWFPHVMTIVLLGDGQLALHSPCRPSGRMVEEIDKIGGVAHVVAPNWFHDLYLAEYRQLYPHATFWGPPVLRRRLGSALIDRELNEMVRPPWFAEMPYVTLSGLLTLDESIFFHMPSRTLILADLLMNLSAGPTAPQFTKIAYRVSGINNRLILPPYLRWFGWADTKVRASLHNAAQQIKKWNPGRLIVGHGVPIQQQAMAQLSSAFALSDNPTVA